MKTYDIVCPSCNGYGNINDCRGISSSATRTCPACNGSGKVSVTEV